LCTFWDKAFSIAVPGTIAVSGAKLQPVAQGRRFARPAAFVAILQMPQVWEMHPALRCGLHFDEHAGDWAVQATAC
jgi:hypothetical protein